MKSWINTLKLLKCIGQFNAKKILPTINSDVKPQSEFSVNISNIQTDKMKSRKR